MKKLLIVFGLLLITACGSTPSGDGNDIVIGGIVALSGSDIAYGTEDMNTADLRIKQINDAGGINGSKLSVIWKDGACDTEIAAKAAEELIKEDKVNIILGGTCSGSTLGISKIANTNHVLQMAHGGSSAKISEAGRYTFRAIPTNNGEWIALHAALFKRDVSSLAILHEDREYNNSLQEKLSNVYKGEIHDELFKEGKTDFRREIGNIQRKGIENIFINIYNLEMAEYIIEQLVELKFEGRVFLNSQVVCYLRVGDYNEQLKSFDEVIGAQYFTNRDTKKLDEFVQQYEDHYGIIPKYVDFMGMMVDAVDILTGVLLTADNPLDTEELVEGMSIVQHVGLGRTIAFDENGDVKIEHQLFKFDGDEFIQIEE